MFFANSWPLVPVSPVSPVSTCSDTLSMVQCHALYPAELGERTVTLDSVDCDGDTALHVLIWRRDTSGALLLIDRGANIDAIGDMGETPLHIALRKENLAVVRALIAAGARTDIVSEFNCTAKAL